MALKQKTKQTQEQHQDIEHVVDEAYALDLEIKQKEKLLKQKKEELKSFAKKTGQKTLEGNEGRVEFSDETRTSIDPFALWELMQELGMEKDFFNVINVKVTDAKNKVGELHLDGIAEQNYNEYAKMKFKKRG
ncbi:MAG: hypothetical protein ACOC4Y_01375 [bacterium]